VRLALLTRITCRDGFLPMVIVALAVLYTLAAEVASVFAGPATFITAIPVGGKIGDTRGCVLEKVQTADRNTFYRATLTVLGVVWPEQARLVELSLKAIPGVRAAKFNLEDSQAVVDFVPGVRVSEKCIRHVIAADSLTAGTIQFSEISFAPADSTASPGSASSPVNASEQR
jgi:hypothetical protein